MPEAVRNASVGARLGGEPPKVLIYALRPESEAVAATFRSAGCTVAFGDTAWEKPGSDHQAALAKASEGSHALFGPSMRNTPLGRAVLQASPSLRVLAKTAVGVDDVDVAAATELGILVCHTPTEAATFSVAEGTLALMLTMLKRVREREADVRAGKWRDTSYSSVYVGRRLSDGYDGLTIGLVGLGRIGARVAQLLAPWRVRILATDPRQEEAAFLLAGAERVDYQTLLRQADVVSYHVVLNDGTRHMLSDPQLALMKPNAIVINTARGGVIDEAALARAIADGRIAGAALDAFEIEPLPMDSPLRALGTKILLSPHATAAVGNDLPGRMRLAVDWAQRAVLAALAGEVPHCVYNKEAIPRWKERFGFVRLTPANARSQT